MKPFANLTELCAWRDTLDSPSAFCAQVALFQPLGCKAIVVDGNRIGVILDICAQVDRMQGIAWAAMEKFDEVYG